MGPSPKYQELKDKGYYPNTTDLKNTKWANDNIYFYIFDYAERCIVGSIKIDNNEYRIVGIFEYGQLNFDLFSSSTEELSSYLNDNGEAYYKCNPIKSGHLSMDYIYENGKIVCTVKSSDNTFYQKGDKVTFEKISNISNVIDKSYECEELGMRINSFSDVHGYYKGEIVLDEQVYPIQAIEIGNSNYYKISIKNNNMFSSTDLVWMVFDEDNKNIVVKITDEHFIWVDNCWEYTDVEYCFKVK